MEDSASVLIVEDEQIIALDLARYVRDLGFKVLGTAASYDSALNKLQSNSVDLILLDINLRGEANGIDLARKIKEEKDIPIIFLTSVVDRQLTEEAQSLFPIAYINKPFDKVQLSNTLKVTFRKFREQQDRLGRLLKRSEFQEISIQELTETNQHLIAATWRERELKNELQSSKEIIEKQNKKITDSINYAFKIQHTIAPDQELLKETLKNYFLFYLPRDIVSGDFPWAMKYENYSYFAAVDCTGHGVPGAMMAMIGNLLFNDIVRSENVVKTPAEILLKLHQNIVGTLKQDHPDSKTNEGMDVALCRINETRTELVFAGAHLPLYHFRNGELTIHKGSSFPVGGMHYRNRNKYKDHVIEIQKGDKIFIFSDGLIDQLGGEEGKKWMSIGFMNFLEKNAALPLDQIERLIESTFREWMGDNKQIDDVILFGVEI